MQRPATSDDLVEIKGVGRHSLFSPFVLWVRSRTMHRDAETGRGAAEGCGEDRPIDDVETQQSRGLEETRAMQAAPTYG